MKGGNALISLGRNILQHRGGWRRNHAWRRWADRWYHHRRAGGEHRRRGRALRKPGCIGHQAHPNQQGERVDRAEEGFPYDGAASSYHVWRLEIRDWGLGIGKCPISNPQSLISVYDGAMVYIINRV